MRKFTYIQILAICLLLISSCSKDEQAMTGNISGFVSDYVNANAAIAGATVTLNNMGRTKTTGSDGRYEFTDLEPGTYSISVAANNYQPTTKQVTVYAGQNANCDFQLESGSVNIDINPLNISFGKDVEQLSFNIKNNSNQPLTYSITNPLDCITVSPITGTVGAKGTQAITIRVVNHSNDRNGQLTVNVGNDSYTISVTVIGDGSSQGNGNNEGGNNGNNEGNGNGNNQGGGQGTSGENANPEFGTYVSRGLRAFYTFDDDTANDATENYNGVMNGGSFITSTPNGKGKALSLKKNEYVSISENPVENRTSYSVSLWAKDFGVGVLLRTLFDQENTSSSPTLYIDSNGKMAYDCSQFHWANYSMDFASLQNKWTMITMVTSDNSNTLYVNGKPVQTIKEDPSKSYGSTMTIGGIYVMDMLWAEPMKVDNVRIYGIALTAEEVTAIYEEESK